MTNDAAVIRPGGFSIFSGILRRGIVDWIHGVRAGRPARGCDRIEAGDDDMEDLAQQMDRVRDELCRLLDMYEEANSDQRRAIARRCEQLGGQVQDLVAMLKFSLLQLRREARGSDGIEGEYCTKMNEVTTGGLRTIHAVGEEIAQAIRYLRVAWGDPEWLTDED